MITSLLVINPKQQNEMDNIREYVSANKEMYDEVIVAVHEMQLSFRGEDYFKKEFNATKVVALNKFAVEVKPLDKKSVYDICGYDINYEVLASCFALADKNIRFRVLSSLIYTSKDQSNMLPPNILLRCFSYSVV